MSKDSNIMGFHSIKNKPHFNTFNLDRRNLFTAKIGQLLPIFCEEVIPGDEIKINKVGVVTLLNLLITLESSCLA